VTEAAAAGELSAAFDAAPAPAGLTELLILDF
jgi:hypothetical protein